MVWRPELLSRSSEIAVTVNVSEILTIFSDTLYIYI